MTYQRILTLCQLALMLVVLMLLLSCSAGINYQAEDKPVALAAVPEMSPKPRVALVLGSGGPRGYAHIGILKVLEEHNIEVDLKIGADDLN